MQDLEHDKGWFWGKVVGCSVEMDVEVEMQVM